MTKELEELKGITKNKIEYIKKQPKIDWIYLKYYEGVLNLVTRIEAIDNANPSEALEHLKDIDDHLKHIDIYYYKNGCDKDINIIKQALLKAQEQEKVLEIIKKKQVDVNLFITIIPFNKSIEELARAYNQCFIERCKLTIEETTLLKEVLEE